MTQDYDSKETQQKLIPKYCEYVSFNHEKSCKATFQPMAKILQMRSISVEKLDKEQLECELQDAHQRMFESY